MDLHIKVAKPSAAEHAQIPGLHARRAERRGQRGDGRPCLAAAGTHTRKIRASRGADAPALSGRWRVTEFAENERRQLGEEPANH